MSVKLAGIAVLPLVPVTVVVEFPMYVDVLYAAVSVSVEVPEVVMEVGEKLAVTPAGNAPVESATVPVNAYRAETLTV